MLTQSLRGSAVRLSLVIPTYNERDNLERIVRELSVVLDEIIPQAYELVIVDDDSPDRTWEIAQELSTNDPRVRLVRRTGERHLARAVLSGFSSANGEVLGTINADLQHPADLVPKLLAAIDSGADVAIASRYVDSGNVEGWSMSRTLLSKAATALAFIVVPETRTVRDPMSGCYLIRRSVLEQCGAFDPNGIKSLIEILVRSKAKRIIEVGYTFSSRKAGRSKMGLKQHLQYLVQLMKLSRL
jgi:dolichol-phosphate mannosyltransferase